VLRRLAQSRGQTFSYPRTKAQASAEIRLTHTQREDAIDRAIERDELARVALPRGATAIGEHEISGCGSPACWTHRREQRS
jgi:hypothetical protein